MSIFLVYLPLSIHTLEKSATWIEHLRIGFPRLWFWTSITLWIATFLEADVGQWVSPISTRAVLIPEIFALLERLANVAEETGVSIILCSHVHAEDTEAWVRDTLANSESEFNLPGFSFGVLTRARTGPTGKYQTLQAVKPNFPYMFVDDNVDIIVEAERDHRCSGVHIQLPRRDARPTKRSYASVFEAEDRITRWVRAS